MSPLHLAAVNLSLAVVTLVLLYLRARHHPRIILLVLSFLPLISLLRPGVYQSGDMQIHATKTLEFSSLLSEGQLFPRWAPHLNATFGYPLFAFTYTAPYYATATLHLLGLSSIVAVKLFLALTYLASGIGLYLLARSRFSPYPSLIAALLYQFAPYHLINLHYRVALGELAALTLIPYLFLFLTHRRRFLSALFLALLILSHPAVSLIFFPLLLLFAWRLRFLSPLLLGLGLSCFYWLPALHDARYTLRALTPFSPVFFPPSHLVISPWHHGLLYQGPTGQLAPHLGFVHLLLLFPAACFAFIRRSVFLRVLLLLFFLYLFLALPLSQPLWNLLPQLRNLQFSYRFLSVLSFLIPLLAAHLLSRIRPSPLLSFLFIAAIILPTTANWANRHTLTYIDDSFIRRTLPFLTAQPGMTEGIEAAPVWVNPDQPWFITLPPSPLHLVSGSGQIFPHPSSSLLHSYTVHLSSPALLQENTVYFPGWTLFVNQQPSPLSLFQGLIRFSLPPGTYQVQLRFLPTPIVLISSTTSLTVLIYFFFTFISKLYRVHFTSFSKKTFPPVLLPSRKRH